MPEMSVDSLVCVYTTACSSNDTYWKKRCSEWPDDSNTILGYTEATRAATRKTTFCRRPRSCLQCSGKVSGSYLQYSTRYRLFSIYFCHLLASKSIYKIQYTTLIVPTSTSTIACQHMLKHTKAFNSAFQTLIRCYVHKTRSFRNLILPPKQPILCTVECHFQC